MSHCARFARTAGLLLPATLLLLTLLPGAVRAETAEELVREALHREIYGASAERSQLLDRAAALSPDYAPAKWHQGYVRVGADWVPANEPLTARNANLTEYQRVRSSYADTLAGQLQLADWCRDHGLAQQERAHLTQVVELDPQHVDAHTRLGFRAVGGDWVLQSDLQQAQQAARRQRQALARHGAALEEIRRLLAHPSGRRHHLAASRLAEIDNPDLIRPLEQALADDSPAAAAALIETLAEMDTREAALAIARQAVFSRWSEVRKLAVVQLRSHDRDDYVPDLLGGMYTPVSARTFAYQAPNGLLIAQQVLQREGRDQREELVLESPQGPAVDRVQVARENYRTQLVNERIAAALNMATDQELPASPEAWWQWWNAENEVYVEGEKPLHSVRPSEQLARIERQAQLEALQRARVAAAWSLSPPPPSQGRRCDCLAAGTLVWTASGSVAVDEMQIGDLVLSQDVETGELAYKAVLRTTVRPATTLVKIHCGEETLQASGGHPFWVSGEGWVKARDLRSGMELHTLDGPRQISLVEDGEQAPSYNLVVADFNSYFIGADRILTHDNTIRKPTDAVVPGLLDR